MIVKFIMFAIFVFILLPVTVFGTTVKFVNVDYGVPEDPFEGAISPGETGDIYFTLRNSYPLPLTDLQLSARPGRCIQAIDGELNKAKITSEEEFRIGPLQIEVKENCKQDEPAAILLSGSYQNSLKQAQRTWVEIPFWIKPRPILVSSTTNIGEPIPMNQSLQIPFSTRGPRFPIKDISIDLNITYSYKNNLIIQLTHVSSQTTVVLHNREHIKTDNLSYGKDGKAISHLQSFFGKSSNTDWELTILNYSRLVQYPYPGVLDRITLKLYPLQIQL